MTRTRIAKGIYRDPYGYEVRWQEARISRHKRFALDTPIDVLKQWRDTKVGLARQHRTYTKDGSFVRDAARFLKSRKGLVSFKSDRAHLRPWVHRFKKGSRWAITREQIIQALDEWRRKPYAARTLRHRLRILKQLFQTLSPEQPTPCDRVKTPTPPKSRPRSVAESVIQTVAERLRHQEEIGRLHDAKTRARFLVLATTGQRPAQLKRAKPADVDLDRRLWFVDPAKGDRGALVVLNDDMHAAWQLYIGADAWGTFDGRSFAKTLYRNGWPKGTRPYTLRHTVGLLLSDRDVDLGDIQALMGHSSPATTRIYVPGLLERAQRAAQKIDGRFGALPQISSTNVSEEKAKEGQKTPQSVYGIVHKKSRLRGSKRLKKA